MQLQAGQQLGLSRARNATLLQAGNVGQTVRLRTLEVRGPGVGAAGPRGASAAWPCAGRGVPREGQLQRTRSTGIETREGGRSGRRSGVLSCRRRGIHYTTCTLEDQHGTAAVGRMRCLCCCTARVHLHLPALCSTGVHRFTAQTHSNLTTPTSLPRRRPAAGWRLLWRVRLSDRLPAHRQRGGGRQQRAVLPAPGAAGGGLGGVAAAEGRVAGGRGTGGHEVRCLSYCTVGLLGGWRCTEHKRTPCVAGCVRWRSFVVVRLRRGPFSQGLSVRSPPLSVLGYMDCSTSPLSRPTLRLLTQPQIDLAPIILPRSSRPGPFPPAAGAACGGLRGLRALQAAAAAARGPRAAAACAGGRFTSAAPPPPTPPAAAGPGPGAGRAQRHPPRLGQPSAV